MPVITVIAPGGGEKAGHSIRTTAVCSACQRGLGGHSEAHSKLTRLEAELPSQLGEPLVTQVIAALEQQSEAAFVDMLNLMKSQPNAFLTVLRLEDKSQK